MPLTFGSVAMLAAKFDTPVTRIDPSDTKAKLDRVVARKVNPSAVANAPRDASVRQAIAGPQPVCRPGPHPVPSEPGRGTNPTKSRSAAETPDLRYQANFAKHRAFFEQRASESNKTQTPERLDRAAIPKRLGTGMHPYTVVWEPMARDNLPHVERVPSRDEAIDRPQTMQPGKSTKTPGPVVNHLANIVRNRKAELQARKASVAPVSENVGQPAKFSMARVVSSLTPSVLPGRDSGDGSPVDNARRPESLSAFLQDVLVDSHIGSSKRALSPASDEHAHSDSESDPPGSSAESSPPSSPNALEPVIPWSQVRAEAISQPAFLPPDDDVTMTELRDALGQLERAIDNEIKYRVSDDAADALDLAMEHYRNGDLPGAYAAVMGALDGVTEILAPPESSEVLTPVDSDYASDSDKQATHNDRLSEALDKAAPLPEGFNRAWMNSRLNLDKARARIQATIKRHAGTTWEGRAKALLAKVDDQARVDRLGAIDMARDGLETIAHTPRRLVALEY